MKTFFNILQTVSDITTKQYPDEPFVLKEYTENELTTEKNNIIMLMNTIFYNAKKCKKQSTFSKNAHAKFTALNSILENKFYQKELKERILDIFTKSQKYYNAFARLAHIHRLKNNPYVVTNDLMMNKLDAKNKLTFILVEHKTNYLFNINEFINIINTAIGHSPNFFSEPLWPLNPYNNQPFTEATIYNAYFKMKQIDRVIPLLFHCFFIEKLNLTDFSNCHESIIRENAITSYVFNSPYNSLYSSVITMLSNNYYTQKLAIHHGFPKDLLVDIFRPYLFLDFISNYYIRGTTKAGNARYLLNIKLRKFYEYNPSFGKQIIKLTRTNNKIVNREYFINTTHISFYNIDVSSELFEPNNILDSDNSVNDMDQDETDSIS